MSFFICTISHILRVTWMISLLSYIPHTYIPNTNKALNYTLNPISPFMTKKLVGVQIWGNIKRIK